MEKICSMTLGNTSVVRSGLKLSTISGSCQSCFCQTVRMRGKPPSVFSPIIYDKAIKCNLSCKTACRLFHNYLHQLIVTAANEYDVIVTSELLTGEEVYGDSGYLGAKKRPETRKKNKVGKSVHYKINRRPSQSKNRSARSQAQIKRCEHEKSSVRAKAEK